MGDFLFGTGIAIAIIIIILLTYILGIKVYQEDNIIAKIVLAILVTIITLGLIIGGLALGVHGVNM